MEVVCEHGFGDKFVEVFEQHETALALEPRVSVAWPKVIVFQRAKFATQKADDPEKWHANVTQSALTQLGVARPGMIQAQLFSERIALLCKAPSYEHSMWTAAAAAFTCLDSLERWQYTRGHGGAAQCCVVKA